MKLYVAGNLTVKGEADGSSITGTARQMITVNAGGVLTLESGTISSTKLGPISAMSSSAEVTINGGTVIGAPALYAYSGTFTITGGELLVAEGSSGDAVEAGSKGAVLTVGATGSYDAPTIEGIEFASSVTNVTLAGGTIDSISGTLPQSAIGNIGSRVTSDFSEALPVGFGCVQNADGYWVTEQLTEKTAAAKVVSSTGGTTLWASAGTAADNLIEGDTLVLLEDVECAGGISIEQRGTTIDLNGHNVTNTNTSTSYKSYGIKIEVSTTGMAADETEIPYVIKNSQPSQVATVHGNDAGIYASTNNSKYTLALTIGEGIVFSSNTEQTIELKNAKLPYSESAAAAISNGGFSTVAEDGQSYIFGSLSAARAARKDASQIITLLNDYTGSTGLAITDGDTVVLDLGGHTYTTSNRSVIAGNGSNANFTVKNGVLVSTARGTDNPNSTPVGVEIMYTAGVPGGSEDIPHTNTSITLDNVTLSMNEDANTMAVYVHGNNSKDTITLKNSVITAGATSCGVYFPPADSTLNVIDSQITAGTGIIMKGGTLNIEGDTTVHATGAKVDPGEGTQSGSVNTGDAVYVEGNYANRTVTVNIKDGIFTSDNGYAVQKAADQGEAKTIAASAGSFSTPLVQDYIAGDLVNLKDNAVEGAPFSLAPAGEAKAAASASVTTDAQTVYFLDATEAKDFAKDNGISDENVSITEFTVTLNSGIPGSKPTTSAVAKNDPLAKPADPVRPGYTFKGWVGADGKAYDFSTPVTANVTLIGTWELNAPTIEMSIDNTTPIVGEEVTISAKVTTEAEGAKIDYRWLVDGRPIMGDVALEKMVVSRDGTYRLEVTITDAEGLTATAAKEVGVSYDGIVMYRLYNRWTGEHFYTSSTEERDTNIGLGWTDEGVGWIAPRKGAVVYRLYNPYVTGGDHHYTTSIEERDACVEAGWRYEGEGWMSADKDSGIPVYRQYNPYATTGTHNYTRDKGEHDHLVSVGWLDEGTAWYALG